MRRQIGLKLRAQDSCNLVYAMWHIAPDSRVAVSVKRNPGAHTHAECHAGGYVTIQARRRVDLPSIRPGESHSLRAVLKGEELHLIADGTLVWDGSLGSEIETFDGPVGFRTDNARFELEYYAGRAGLRTSPGAQEGRPGPCSTRPED
jgi:hypothetical protein